jgi:hypothetical protein
MNKWNLSKLKDGFILMQTLAVPKGGAGPAAGVVDLRLLVLVV